MVIRKIVTILCLLTLFFSLSLICVDSGLTQVKQLVDYPDQLTRD